MLVDAVAQPAESKVGKASPAKRECVVAWCPMHGPVAASDLFLGTVTCPRCKGYCATQRMRAI